MGKSTPLAKLIGDKRLLKKLDNLSRKMKNKVCKKATEAGARVVVKAVKAEVRSVANDEGVLAKAESFKIVGKGENATAFIGADVNKMVTETDGLVRPSNLDSLVEYGFQHESGKTVPGKYPLRKGAEASQAEAMNKMKAVMKAAIDNAT